MSHWQTRRAEAAAVASLRLDRPVPPNPPHATTGVTGSSAHGPIQAARPGRRAAPSRSLASLHPGRAQVMLWRVAAVAFLAASSLSAALLSSSLADGGAVVAAAALATDAAIVCAAGLVVAVTARRAARLAAASLTALHLCAVSTARHAGVWPPEHGTQISDMTRLLCAGAVAVVILALLSWLDNGTPDAP